MSNIKVTNPWLFLIAIPLVLALAVGFILLPKTAKARPKNLISLALHIVMIGTLCCSFADIQYLKINSKTEVYVLADCSSSIEPSIDRMDELVSQVYSDVESGTQVGVIAFGKNQEMIYPLSSDCANIAKDFQADKKGNKNKSMAVAYDADKHPNFDPSATDLKSALLYVNDLFSTDSVKRVVVISDGVETDNSAIDAVQTLVSNNVTIDTVLLDDTSDLRNEIAISGLEYTDCVYSISTKSDVVKVLIRAKSEHLDTTIKIYENGAAMENGTYTDKISQGLNVVEFPLDNTVGTHNYVVKIEGVSQLANNDYFDENNTMSFSQSVTDNFRILFVGGAQSDYDDFTTVYADQLALGKTTIDAFRLDGKDDNCKIRSDTDKTAIPYELKDLVDYDEIVLSDINFSTTSSGTTAFKATLDPDLFMENVEKAVSLYGKALITFGSTASNANQSDANNTLNDLLPVQFDSDEGKAVCLLIDVSGSMETNNRFGKAKQGAIACLDILNEKDYVAVVVFGDSTKVYQPLTSVKNKEDIIKNIKRISMQGGTSMVPGLKGAYNQLKNADFDYKHVITLSDGEPSETKTQIFKQIDILTKANIACSFINIQCSSGASLLKALAKRGNGSYWYASTSSALVNIMMTSIATDISNTHVDSQEGGYEISVKTEDDESLANITTKNLINVSSYNYCRTKRQATTVLTVPYYITATGESEASGILDIPLYAYWTYGKGKVTSFTGDLSTADGGSIVNWLDVEDNKQLLHNIYDQAFPERSTSSFIDVSYVVNGSTTKVQVTAPLANKEGIVTAVVTAPDDAENNITDGTSYDLYYDGKYFSALIPTNVMGGLYKMVISYSYAIVDTDTDVTTYSDPIIADVNFYFNYSAEYDCFTDHDTNILYKLAKNNGTYSDNGTVDYQAIDSEIANKSYKSTMMFFMLLSCSLFLVDVFVRKSTFAKKRIVNI